MASFKGRKMHLSIDLEVTLFCFVGEFPPGSPLLTNLLAPNAGRILLRGEHGECGHGPQNRRRPRRKPPWTGLMKDAQPLLPDS